LDEEKFKGKKFFNVSSYLLGRNIGLKTRGTLVFNPQAKIARKKNLFEELKRNL